MKLNYLLQRFLHRYVLTRQLESLRIAPGFYLKSQGDRQFGSVEFHLDNPLFVHLGDQLFYEPAIVALTECGIPVTVHASSGLASYFATLLGGVKRSQPVAGSDGKERLHVVPLAIYGSLDWSGKSVLVVNFTDTHIAGSISEMLRATVFRVLGLGDEFVPPLNRIDRKVALSDMTAQTAFPAHAILFSNYVDSGSFKITPAARRMLDKAALRLKAAGHCIVHVGSGREKLGDPQSYPFVDLDMRGETTPLDLLAGFHSTNVEGAVTFDTFVMHACLMAGKPAQVRFKGRFTSASTFQHMNYINETLAPPGSRLVTYL